MPDKIRVAFQLLFAIISFITLVSIPEIIFFLMIRFRNHMVKKLANEFNLTFEDTMPGFWSSFWYFNLFKDVALNHVYGEVNGHTIDIQDIQHESVLKFWQRGIRETILLVDGKRFEGTPKNLTLGSIVGLSTTYEIRQYLQSLGK